MSEEDSQEKTEQPSAKRLRESRQKGQIARSKDFNATFILLFSSIGFLMFGKQLTYHLAMMMRQAFEFNTNIIETHSIVTHKLVFLMNAGLLSLVPVLIVIFILSFIAPLLMGGWVFSVETLQPKVSRMNLFKGLKRMVSLKGLVEMIKSFFKFLLVAIVSVIVLKQQIPQLLSLADMTVDSAIGNGAYIIVKSFVLIASSMVIIALVDVPFQLYEHNKQMKMSKQELKDEYKETEGKPEVKSAIRRAQQEIARRRMMSEVPKASVIITNPTHYAVALRYDQKGKRAPIVVAKGKDLIAFHIAKIAKENDVPILAVPPLARAVYFSTKLNKEIPRGLYVAVAQVLAYVFQLRNKQYYDHNPEILQNVPIPADLVREAEEIAE